MNSFLSYISEKVRNASGVLINPATEEKQDTLNNLADAIYELTARLSFLPSIRGVSADIRTTVVGGSVAVSGNLTSVTTVTTVTTVGNQSSLGGYSASPLVSSQVNMNAAISNINNITIGT